MSYATREEAPLTLARVIIPTMFLGTKRKIGMS